MSFAPLLAGFFLAMSAARMSAEEWSHLVGNSPFGGGPAGAVAGETPASLEFRGFVQEGDVRLFNIYDQSARKAQWISDDIEEAGLKIEQFDEDKRVIVLRQRGRQLRLPLKQAVVVQQAYEAPPPVAGFKPKPTGDSDDQATIKADMDEKSRLQQIAEEVRRRRQLRAQAVENTARQAPAE